MMATTELAPQSENGALRQIDGLNSARLASTTSGETDSARAIAEVQGAIIVAQRNPRDTVRALDRILNAFQRPKLAEKAMYAYPRGGETVSGLSVRAAEAIAQNWGNFQFGWREIDRRDGHSIVDAFAWDVETNTRAMRSFQVTHVRDTKKGTVILKDERDIYEIVANNAARRKRACILELIPYDVQEAVIEQAHATLQATVKVTKDTIAALIAAFSEIGVSTEALQKRLRRRMDAMTPVQYLELRRIYATIKDGITRPEDYFEIEPTYEAESGASKTEAIGAELAQRAASESEKDAPAVDATTVRVETPAADEPAAAAKQQEPASLRALPDIAKASADDLAAFIVDELRDRDITEAEYKTKILATFGHRLNKANFPGVIQAIRAHKGVAP